MGSDDQPPTLKIGTTPEAQRLAELLFSLPDEQRRALIALAVNEGLQLGVLKAALEWWPCDVPVGEGGEAFGEVDAGTG